MKTYPSKKKSATKEQLELLMSLKSKNKLPCGNLWNLTMHEAYHQIIALYSFKLN